MQTSSVVLIVICLAFTAPGELQAQQNPGDRPLSPQEIQRQRRQVNEETKSNVEAIFDYSTQSGDVNNSLDYFRYGARLNLKRGTSPQFFMSATHTQYMPAHDEFRETGMNFTGGIQGNPSDSVDFQIEAGATRFSTDTTTFNALGLIRFIKSEDTVFHLEASRRNVEDSLLSVSGLRPALGPFAGQLVGRVMENGVLFGGTSYLTNRFDVFGEGGVGTREGSNVPANFYKEASGGVGYSVVGRSGYEPLTLLRTAYELEYYGFDEDRFGFDGASLLESGRLISRTRLGADRLASQAADARARIGGYFSPKHFITHLFRVEAQGHYEASLDYNVSAFFGSQDYTGTERRSASGVSGTVTFHLTDVASLPLTYSIDNFGPFTTQWLYARLVYRF